MHRWLAWLFRRRAEAEVDTAPAPAAASVEAPASVAIAEAPVSIVEAEATAPEAVPEASLEEVPEGTLEAVPEASVSVAVADVPVEVPSAAGPMRVAIPVRETCPVCGRTGVFAGPPGHRYCMRCALREEL